VVREVAGIDSCGAMRELMYPKLLLMQFMDGSVNMGNN
jgi:hypothetical protein